MGVHCSKWQGITVKYQRVFSSNIIRSLQVMRTFWIREKNTADTSVSDLSVQGDSSIYSNPEKHGPQDDPISREIDPTKKCLKLSAFSFTGFNGLLPETYRVLQTSNEENEQFPQALIRWIESTTIWKLFHHWRNTDLVAQQDRITQKTKSHFKLGRISSAVRLNFTGDFESLIPSQMPNDSVLDLEIKLAEITGFHCRITSFNGHWKPLLDVSNAEEDSKLGLNLILGDQHWDVMNSLVVQLIDVDKRTLRDLGSCSVSRREFNEKISVFFSSKTEYQIWAIPKHDELQQSILSEEDGIILGYDSWLSLPHDGSIEPLLISDSKTVSID
jgi:hypothetical protein